MKSSVKLLVVNISILKRNGTDLDDPQNSDFEMVNPSCKIVIECLSTGIIFIEMDSSMPEADIL